VNELIETHSGSWILVAGPRTIRVAMLVACLLERGAVNVLSCGNQFISYPGSLFEARNYIGQRLDDLAKERVPRHELLVNQRLNRELTEYRPPSWKDRAVWQMQVEGKRISPVQLARFLYTLGEPGVTAWYAIESTDISMVDSKRYRILLMRAVQTVVEPIEKHFGIMPQATTYSLFPNKKTGPPDVEGIQRLGTINVASIFDLYNDAVGR
jgi:hypothetical protein